MSLKFYLTDWLPELGRYATMIAVFQNPLIKSFISESFVFAIDKELQFYDGQRCIYSLPDIPEYNDEAKLHEHALRYVDAIIHLNNDEVSKSTNNREILLKEWKQHESRAFIVLGEIYRKYEERLRWLAGNTESEELKDLIRSFAKVMISNPVRRESII